MNVQETFALHGFKYPENLIMAFIGGSTQHGAKGDDSTGSDTDWYGIFIPPKEYTLGIDSYDSFVFPSNTEHRTRGERDPLELDISLHSLQKWAVMAAKGNPTVLSFLFSDDVYPQRNCKLCGIWKRHHSGHCDPKLAYTRCQTFVNGEYDPFYVWGRIVNNTNLFLCKKHLYPFLYYAKDQMERLQGLRGQKNVNRDHLTDKYGYDTKYAMHIIRLLSEAKELMEHGRITYPRPEVEVLKSIRRGAYKLAEIVEMGKQLEAEAIAAHDKSSLPDRVSRTKISKLIADVTLEFYSTRRPYDVGDNDV